MGDTRLSMSFTAGTLLYRETILVAGVLGEMKDWHAVRERVISNNLLQMRTISSSRRIFKEVSSRLRCLTSDQLSLLVEGLRQEQNYLLWLAVCKRYRFIYGFAVEVLREKHLRMYRELSYDDYDLFFNGRAEWHPEVENVAPSTRAKQRQVVFKMMREAELLSTDNRIIPAVLSPRLVEVIRQDDPAHLAIFPLASRQLTDHYPS